MRLLVIPFTLHKDILFIHRYPHHIVHGEWDIFGIAARDGLYYYSPLLGLFAAFCQWIFGGLFPGYEELLHSTWTEVDALGSPSLFLSLFLLKVPYFIFDAILLRCGWSMLADDGQRRRFTLLWAVNPLAIYATYMIGQTDIIPFSLTVLACWLALQKGREHFACLAIAAGFLFKLFPMVFLPLVIWVAARDVKHGLFMSLFAVLPVAAAYGGFYLVSGDAVFEVFKAFSYNLAVTGERWSFVWRLLQASVYLAVCLHFLVVRRRAADYPLLIRYFLVIYLAVHLKLNLGWTHYFSWYLPFMVLFVVLHPGWERAFYIFLGVIFLSGLRSREMFLGMLAPLNPELFYSLPSLQDVAGVLFGAESYYAAMDAVYKAASLAWIAGILMILFRRRDAVAEKTS